jgi:hypothetical protein
MLDCSFDDVPFEMLPFLWNVQLEMKGSPLVTAIVLPFEIEFLVLSRTVIKSRAGYT